MVVVAVVAVVVREGWGLDFGAASREPMTSIQFDQGIT